MMGNITMASHQLLHNLTIIGPGSLKEKASVLISDRRIAGIFSDGRTPDADGHILVHDCGGAFLAPGFIDMHSDNIESLVQPRPASVMDFGVALMEQEKQLVNQGITTMYHSLTLLGESTKMMRDKETRKPEKMKELTARIAGYMESPHLIRHKFHCRFDIRNIEGLETLNDYIARESVHLLSFTDHTPGQGQYRDLDRYRETMKKYNPNLGDGEIEDLIRAKMTEPRLTRGQIERTAGFAAERGIPIASHDDDSLEKLEYVQRALNAGISEFPVELAIARKAKERGMYTIAGAPNVLLGRSHSGNVSATEAILDGAIDILCSDYYPPAMLHAVWRLHNRNGLSLYEAVNLVTLNPARALGIDRDFGSVEEGKIADLLCLQFHDGRPYVSKVFIDGQLVSQLNYRQGRNGTPRP